MLHVLYLCSARFAAKEFGGPEKSALVFPSLRFPAKSGKSAKRAKFGALLVPIFGPKTGPQICDLIRESY